MFSKFLSLLFNVIAKYLILCKNHQIHTYTTYLTTYYYLPIRFHHFCHHYEGSIERMIRIQQCAKLYKWNQQTLYCSFIVVLAFSIPLCSNYSIFIKPSNSTMQVSLLSFITSRTTCFGPLLDHPRAKICTYGTCKNYRNTMGSHSVLHGCIKSCMLIKLLLYKNYRLKII